MQGIHFDQIADDSRINAIGPLFRKVDGSQWGINLGFFPSQKKRSLTVSNVPVLARKRVLNPTQSYHQAGYKRTFSIVDTQSWEEDIIGNCPILKKQQWLEKDQLCFVFQANDGVTIYLPQFELARALFLHDGYMSRTALEAECLKAEFDINIDSESNTALVNVLPSSGYPLVSFNDPETRRVLSWILIDTEARASFESIGQCQKLRARESRGYRLWDFQFSPPLLSDAEFEVTGYYESSSNTMFVYEVTAIRNIHVNVPELVDYYHPKFEEQVKGEGSGSAGDCSTPSDYILEEQEANANGGRKVFHAPTVEFGFAEAFKTRKVADKKRTASSGRKDEEADSVTTEHASVEEATLTGTSQGGEWDTVSDLTDDTHLYMNKFSAFLKMLEYLKNDYGCIIHPRDIRKLPALSRCTKHLLRTDGNPRCMIVVPIELGGQVFHVLEVDTSDEAKALSTQILQSYSFEKMTDELMKEVEHELLRKSLRWPREIFGREFGKGGFKGVPHPQTTASNKGVVETSTIKQWAARFYEWMSSV